MLTFAASAMHLLASFPSLVFVVIMQNLFFSMKYTKSSIFSCRLGSSWFFAVNGSAGFEPVSVLDRDISVLFNLFVLIDWEKISRVVQKSFGP